jgi:hypothetical protein
MYKNLVDRDLILKRLHHVIVVENHILDKAPVYEIPDKTDVISESESEEETDIQIKKAKIIKESQKEEKGTRIRN